MSSTSDAAPWTQVPRGVSFFYSILAEYPLTCLPAGRQVSAGIKR
ncbi:MAG: hypothetical protein V1656_01765 [Candidatus Jorgensenbacteria bacterium]